MSSAPDKFLFSLFFLTRMSILFFCEIPLLLYLSSLYPNRPFVCLQAFLRILVTSTLCCRWWKGLVTVKLLFRSHFPINIIDKVGVRHSMWRRKLFLRRNFLPSSLPSLLPLFLTIKHYKTLLSLTLLP